MADVTDDELGVSIAGMVEAVILRRLAAVQRQTARDDTSWSPWAMLGRWTLRVAADVNEVFARHLDSGTSLAEIARAQGHPVCTHCDGAPDAAITAERR